MTALPTSVIRPLILRLAGHPWFRRIATNTRPGRAVASRFVAGETLDQAMTVASELDRMRVAAMLDHLGENVETASQAADARDAYLAALDAIRLTPTLDIAVSLKLSQLGLDRSVKECLANVEPILAAAGDPTTLVMIDMEAHGYVERTLEVVRTVHAEHPRVGVALQSYLRRSATDVFDLPAGIRVRLVKGSYLEPPDVVFAEKQEVDENFRRLFSTLFARGTRSMWPRTIRSSSRASAGSSMPARTAGYGSSSRCCTVCAGICRPTSRGAATRFASTSRTAPSGTPI